MKKSKVTRSLLAACSIVALTAVMYGCTHDGDDPPATGDTDMEMPDPAIAERAAITNAITTANTAVAAVTDTASDGMVAAADAAITAARTAISNATNVPAEEKAAHTTTVTTLETALSTAKTSRTAAMEAAEKLQADASFASAKSLLRAFNRALDATPAATHPAITSVSASSGGAFKVTTTTTDVGKFESAEAPDMVVGHHGAMLMHDDEEMVVYSSIDNADAKPLDEVFEETGDPGSNDYDVTDDGTGNSVPRSAITVADELVVTRDTNADMATFPGNVNGAMGTFSCTISNDTCADPVAADGAITSTLGTIWTFKPNAGARTDVADTDYVYFGWWLKKATGDWRLDTIAGHKGYGAAGADATPRTDLAGALTGSATYSGAAAGKFAIVGAGEGQAGHFVADAELKVDFDADNAPDTPGNDELGVTISGMIDEFMANGTSRDWTVALTWDRDGATLGLQPVGANINAVDTALGGKDATWKDGDITLATGGDWTANFYGTDEDDNNLPMAAAGEFRASAGDAIVGHHIAGGFGVEKE